MKDEPRNPTDRATQYGVASELGDCRTPADGRHRSVSTDIVSSPIGLSDFNRLTARNRRSRTGGILALGRIMGPPSILLGDLPTKRS